MTKRYKKELKIAKFLFSLAPYLKFYKGLSVLSLVCIFLIAGFMTIVPISYKYIFDNIVKSHNESLLLLIFGVIIIAFIVRTIADSVVTRLITKITAGIILKLRLKLFNHVQNLSEDFYFTTPSSELIACYSDDINCIEQALVNTALPVLRSLLVALISFILIIWLAWPAAVMLFILVAFSLAIPQLLSNRRNQAIHLQKKEQKKLLVAFQEFIAAHVVIRLYNLMNLWANLIGGKIESAAKTSKEANFYNMFAPRSLLATTVLAQVLVVFIGAFAVIRGQVTLGTIISLIPLSNYILVSSDFLVTALPIITQAAAAMNHINEILSKKSNIPRDLGAKHLPAINNNITFQNVSFSYDDHKKILIDITLKLTYGKAIALVGSSGSGKSTILNLLMRLYDPTVGTIIFDDQYKSTDVTEESLRHQLAIVLQEPLLFNMSVKENIRMGNLEATEDEITEAAKKAGLHNDIICLPNQYDTVIGVEGKSLSGGQRQRLALARGFVRKPRILLLDEVTSAVDAITEAEINKSILEYTQYGSVITTTHRLTLAPHMSEIFVLEQGKIIEHGTHHDLLQKHGLYAKMWEKQHSINLTPEKEIVSIDIKYLSKIPILQYCTLEFLDNLSKQFVVESYGPNEIIFKQDTFGNKFYLVARGTVEIWKSHQLVAALSDGDYFGELALLSSDTRNATVKTRSPCILLTISRSQFEKLLLHVPEIKAAIEKIVIERNGNSRDNPAS